MTHCVIIFGCCVVVFSGEIMECWTSNPFESPYLLSVRPLAVVAGEENRVVVNGFNLTSAVTRYEIAPTGGSHPYEFSDVSLFPACC